MGGRDNLERLLRSASERQKYLRAHPHPSGENGFRFTPKEAAMFLISSLLAAAGLTLNDPWVIYPLLVSSWAMIMYLCWAHKSGKFLRIVGAILATIIFGRIVFWDIEKKPEVIWSAELMNMAYQENEKFGGITWRKDWRAISLHITNKNGPPVTDLDVTLSGPLIEDVGQLDSGAAPCKSKRLADYSFPRDPKLPDPDDLQQRNLDMSNEKVHGFSGKWRVSCSRIDGGDAVKLIVAIAYDSASGLTRKTVNVSGVYEFGGGRSEQVNTQIVVKH
jgi:hypothetical protein